MKYLISVLFIITGFGLKAQSFTPESHRQFPFIKIDSGAIFTPGDTTGRASVAGAIKYKSSDHSFYYHNGTKWHPFVTDSLGMIAKLNDKVDSLTLASDILYYWKVGVGYGVTLPIGTDSAYTRISAPNDSTLVFYRFNGDSTVVSVNTVPGGGGSMTYPGAGIAVSNGSAWVTSLTDNSANWNTVLNRVLYTDTASMLSHYLRKIDTTNKWVNILANIGSSPNANAGSISGNTLTLQPASASFGGVVNTTTQTFAGSKTFSSKINSNVGIAIGSTPPSSTSQIDVKDNGTIIATLGTLSTPASSGRALLQMVSGGTSPSTQIGYDFGLNADLSGTYDFRIRNLRLGTFSVPFIIQDSTNYIGIGTTNPQKILHTVGTVRHASLGTATTDTTTYKPLAINSSGDLLPMTGWVVGGGSSTDTTNYMIRLFNGYGINQTGTFPTKTISVDTAGMATRLRVQKGIDSLGLLKLNISDTSAMQANDRAMIFQRVRFTDTTSMLANYQTQIFQRVRYSDTATMLSPYYKTAFATSALALKVNISDTSSMLTNYRHWLAGYVKYTDTASMLSGYLRKTDSINLKPRIFAGTGISISGTYPVVTITNTGGGTTYTASAPVTLTGSAFGLDTTNIGMLTKADANRKIDSAANANTTSVRMTTTDFRLLKYLGNNTLFPKGLRGGYGIIHDSTTAGDTIIITKVDTATLFPAVRSTITSGSGSTNTSVGSGYKVAINGTNNIKSLTSGYGLSIDSATANQVNYKVDSATLSTKYLRITDTTSKFPRIFAGTNVTVTGTFPNVIVSASGGSAAAGGSNTQVQYNSSGALAGISGATTDGTTMTLTAPAINNIKGNYTSTATAAGTTTLTSSSTYTQNFTGSTTQTIVLPDATTLTAGMGYYFTNPSTGVLTVNKNGGTLLATIAAGQTLSVTVTDISTAAGVWNYEYSGALGIIDTASMATRLYAQKAADSIVLSYASVPPNASKLVRTDANGSILSQNIIHSNQTVATAAGTTTITVTSPYRTIFTGSSTQTFKLPSAITLRKGQEFYVDNNSTLAISVVDNGSNAIYTIQPLHDAYFLCADTSTTNGVWDLNAHASLDVPNTFANTITTATGTTAIAAINIPVGVAQTTPLTGDITRPASGVFTATVASGENGILPSEQYSVVGSDFTLSAALGVQSAFPTTGDVWTLAGSTLYEVEGNYIMTTGTTTTKTTGIAFALAGGASVNYVALNVQAWNAVPNTSATAQNTVQMTQVASTVVTVTATTAGVGIYFKGVISMNAAGTLTPQINFSANPGGTNLMKAGSYIKFRKLGANTFTVIGAVN